jgi:hypothetical protein
MEPTAPRSFEEKHEAMQLEITGHVLELTEESMAHYLGIVALLESLRFNEGASVMFHSDNPEPEDVDHQAAIEVSDDWTDWKWRRFDGQSVADCLKRAVKAKQQHGQAATDAADLSGR